MRSWPPCSIQITSYLLGCFYLCQTKCFQKGAGEGIIYVMGISILNFYKVIDNFLYREKEKER